MSRGYHNAISSALLAASIYLSGCTSTPKNLHYNQLPASGYDKNKDVIGLIDRDLVKPVKDAINDLQRKVDDVLPGKASINTKSVKTEVEWKRFFRGLEDIVIVGIDD